MKKIIIIGEKHNVKDLACIILVKLSYPNSDVVYKFSDDVNFTCSQNDSETKLYKLKDFGSNDSEKLLNFYYFLIDTWEFVRKDSKSILRIINSDIKEFVNTIARNGKKGAIIENIVSIMGDSNFVEYFVSYFNRHHEKILILEENVINASYNYQMTKEKK